MPPETEVISCPACKHLVRVPADWLGQPVQCPECKATFTAPVRAGDVLTDPVLLTAPAGGAPAPARAKADVLLTLPAFGLMLVGVAALLANGVLFVKFVTSPDGGKDWLRTQMPVVKQMGALPADPDADKAKQEREEEEAVADLAPKLRWAWLAAAAAGAVTFAGGLSIVRRTSYKLAQLGCVLAAVNLPHLCCVPGAAFGLWGLLMLMTDEGREHFQK